MSLDLRSSNDVPFTSIAVLSTPPSPLGINFFHNIELVGLDILYVPRNIIEIRYVVAKLQAETVLTSTKSDIFVDIQSAQKIQGVQQQLVKIPRVRYAARRSKNGHEHSDSARLDAVFIEL